MIDFPAALHIPSTPTRRASAFHPPRLTLFENNDTGERFDVQAGGYFYLAGHIVHEAWVPAGAQAIIILEDGWTVNWLDGAPTARDIGHDKP